MKFAQVLCLVALVGCAFTNSCVGNPVVDKLAEFIESYSESFENSNVATGTKLALMALNLVQPATATLEGCPDFSGVDSCCNSAMADTFPMILQAYFTSQKHKKIKSQALMEELAYGLLQCGGEEELKQFFGGSGEESIGSFSNGFLSCRDEAVATISKLISGTMCSICAASDDYATYFDQSNGGLKIISDADNWASYEAALTASFTCFSEQTVSFSAWVEEKLTNLNNDQCAELKENIIAKIDAGALEVSTACDDGVLTSSCIDSSVAEVDPAVRRFLSTSTGYTTGNGGMTCYNEDADVSGSETEKDVDYVYQAKVAEEEEGPAPEVETGDKKNTTDGDESSSQILSLTLAIFLAVFAVVL